MNALLVHGDKLEPMFTIELQPDEWLRIMRSRLELTQGELAERLGIERRSVMRYELGICKIPQARLEAIMRMTEESLS